MFTYRKMVAVPVIIGHLVLAKVKNCMKKFSILLIVKLMVVIVSKVLSYAIRLLVARAPEWAHILWNDYRIDFQKNSFKRTVCFRIKMKLGEHWIRFDLAIF